MTDDPKIPPFDLPASGKGGGNGDIKVVDRRWWARDEPIAAEEQPSLKPSYVEELEGRLAEKDAELRATIAKYREASSEFEQARARLRKEIGRDAERDRRSLLVEFLDVLDNLDRALEAARHARDVETLVAGVEMVRKQFLSKLEWFSVRRIDPLGAPFDPATQDAMSTVPVSDPAADNTVVGVISPGYAIGDDVLRPARVAVGKLSTTR